MLTSHELPGFMSPAPANGIYDSFSQHWDSMRTGGVVRVAGVEPTTFSFGG